MGCQQSRLSDPVLVQNPSFGLSPKSTSPLHAGAAGSRVLPPEAPSPLCATAEELSKKPPLPAAPPSPALSRQSPSTAVVSSPLLAAPVALQHVASELTATHDPGVPAAADARPRLVSSALCDESLVARSKSEAVQPVSAAALSPESALPPPPAAAAPPVVPAIPLPLPAVAASPPVPVVSAVPSQGGAASASVTTRAVPPRSAAPPLPRLPTSEGPFVSPRGGRDVIEVTSERKIKDAATGEKRVNQYLMREVLGRGAYGKVRRCVDEQTGAVRAVKIIRKSVLKRKRVGRFGNALQTVLREIAIWKKLDHPNVVTLFEVIDDAASDKLYMISEYVDGGCLMPDDKNGGNPLPLPLARHLMRQLLETIAYLHFQRVVHRDIKPGNLLVSQRTLKVTDFGVSHVFESSGEDLLRSTVGTAAFQAPEMCTGGTFSGRKADLWACGMTLFMMLHGRPAFMAATLPEIYALITTQPVVWTATEGSTPEESKDFLLARDLALGLLEKDPERRLSIDSALAHPFFASPPPESCNFTPGEAGSVGTTAASGAESVPPLALPRRIVVSDADIQAAIDTLRSFRAAVKAATAGSRSLARARLRAADRGAGNAESRRPASASAAPGGGGATGRSAFLRDAAPGDIADSSRMHGGSTTRRSEADFRMLFRSNTAPTGLDTQRSTPRFGGIGEPPDRSGAVSTSTSTPGSTRSWGYGRGADAGAKGVHDDTVDGEPPFTGTAAEEPGSHASLSPPRRASFIGSVPGVLISGDGLRGSIVGRGRDVDTLSRASKRDLDAGQAAAAAAIDGVSAVASQIGPGLE